MPVWIKSTMAAIDINPMTASAPMRTASLSKGNMLNHAWVPPQTAPGAADGQAPP
jgi:hypothetical protein